MVFLIILCSFLILKPSKQSVCKVCKNKAILQHLPLSSPLQFFLLGFYSPPSSANTNHKP